MKFLINIMEGVKPHFQKDGKYAKLYPAYEAFQTFLYLPKHLISKAPFIRDAVDTKRYMTIVLIALTPCLLFGIYNTGYQSHLATGQALDLLSVILTGLKSVVPILIVSYGVGLGIEFLSCIIRGHEVNEGFLVTGMLYALILPPETPLWMVGVGIAFGVLVGKEIFGGSGRNFLNPALTARAFLFFSYPAYLSGDSVWTYFGKAKNMVIDGYSGATALSVAAYSQSDLYGSLANAGYTFKNAFLGFIPGSIGETSTLCVLIGAAILLVTKVGSWRTMAGSVIGLTVMSLILNVFQSETTVPVFGLTPMWHMVIGSFAFGTVFMATDPVSSPHINESKWIYGFLIGVVTVIIRCVNPAYPEGVMLAILLLNSFAPVFDLVILRRKTSKRIANGI